MRARTQLLLSLAALFLICSANTAEFPKEKWKMMKNPAKHGWSAEKLKAALDFAKASHSSAIQIVQDGLIVDQFGDVDKKISSYSVRKSLISALYGIYSAEGVIDINQTLEQLGIDDSPDPLTKEEKKARIVDILRARSGVYHPVDFESPAQKKFRPAR